MLLHLNHDSKTPLYIQIYQQIKEKIHQHELETNEKLTSKRQLAELNQVSENTVMNAYNQLLTEGYIYAKERKGYYVANIKLLDQLPTMPKKSTPKKPKTTIQYQLTRSNPDKNLFPYSVFSKLYRNVLNHPPETLLAETEGQGLYALREALQHYLSQSRGVPSSAEQIILGPSSEYLMSILMQLLAEDTVVGIEDPGYRGFNAVFNRQNKTTTAIPVDEMGADIEALQKSNVQLMIVTSNHQFPTGSIMPLPRRQQLLNWAAEQEDRFIVENDYDSEFKYAGIPIPSLNYLDQHQKVIHLGSFTRVLSPGIRLSYMVLPETLLARYHEKFPAQSAALSTTEQWVIHDFITEGHFTTHLNRSRTFYKKKRDQFLTALHNQDPKAQVLGENAGLHLLVRPSFPFDGERFKQLAMKEGIALRLLSDFSENPADEDKNTLFISFSTIPKDEIEKLVQKLYFLIKTAT